MKYTIFSTKSKIKYCHRKVPEPSFRVEREENFSHLYSAFDAGLYSFQAPVLCFPPGRGCLAVKPGMAAGMSKWSWDCFRSLGRHGFHKASQ